MTRKLWAAGLCSLALFCSCDDEKKLPTDTPICQEYEVFINEGSVAAFANFRAYGAEGQRVELNNGASIRVNGREMMYAAPNSDTEPEYTYSYPFSTRPEEVTFTFTRGKDQTYVNSVSLSESSPVSIATDLVRISNGVQYAYETTMMKQQVVLIALAPTVSTDDKVYYASLDMFNQKFQFQDVPAGTYQLVAQTELTFAVTQQDQGAGGTVKLVNRGVSRQVIVD